MIFSAEMPGSSQLTKLGVLLRKNVWLKRRSPIGTICEFLCPMIFISLACVAFWGLKKLDITVRSPTISIRNTGYDLIDI